MNSPQDPDQKSAELVAVLWKKCLDENLIVCSFTMRDDPFRYTGTIKRVGAWKAKVLKSSEALSKAFLYARNSRNGCFAIALVRPDYQSEKLLGESLLTQEQAFGSYIQLIEFVDGTPVVYDDKGTAT